MFGFFKRRTRRRTKPLPLGHPPSHSDYKEEANEKKKREGRWLPREEYERRTGRKGRD